MSPSPPPIPALRPSGRPNRQIRLPARFLDNLPPAPPPTIQLDACDDVDMDASDPEDSITPVIVDPPFRTPPDSFGMFREYPSGRPSFTPDETYTLSDVSDSPNLALDPDSYSRSWFSPWGSSEESVEESVHSGFAPFENISRFRLMSWYYNSSGTKSLAELDSLVNGVILPEDFRQEHFFGFKATKELDLMDKYLKKQPEKLLSSPFSAKDGWIEASVFISVPCDGVKHALEADAPKFEVKGLYYRRPLEVIKAAFRELAAEKFHITPFKSYWKPGPDEPEERIYSESFTGDMFLKEYAKIRSKIPKHDRELIVAALLTYSDSTHLTNFGTASLWPLYLYIGNQSKYTRAKPTSFSAHHLAYIPKVCSYL